jgi:precorrin-2 dehydrogenase/sirohydrochlorin ferrochelatase
VGTRKAQALHEAGATVRVISPEVTPALNEIAASSSRLTIERRRYSGASDLSGANVVFAATGTKADEQVAGDARRLNKLVNVASAGESGSFSSMAVHRNGPLTIGVSAGDVPQAAGAIRDSIAARYDARYADAIIECSAVRRDTLSDGDATRWAELSEKLIGKDFCERVEKGTFAEALRECR